jgi:hypothetical protein
MSVFSSEFWRSLYFRAIGGQASEAAGPTGEMAAVITASSSVVATISFTQRTVTETGADTHDGAGPRKRRPEISQHTLDLIAEAQDAQKQRRRADQRNLRDTLRHLFGIKDEPPPAPPAPDPQPALQTFPALVPQPENQTARLEAEAAQKQKDEDDALILLLLAA